VRRNPRCPSCGLAAFPEGEGLDEKEIVGLVAMPDGAVQCSRCGHLFRLADASEWT